MHLRVETDLNGYRHAQLETGSNVYRHAQTLRDMLKRLSGMHKHYEIGSNTYRHAAILRDRLKRLQICTNRVSPSPSCLSMRT